MYYESAELTYDYSREKRVTSSDNAALTDIVLLCESTVATKCVTKGVIPPKSKSNIMRPLCDKTEKSKKHITTSVPSDCVTSSMQYVFKIFRNVYKRVFMEIIKSL